MLQKKKKVLETRVETESSKVEAASKKEDVEPSKKEEMKPPKKEEKEPAKKEGVESANTTKEKKTESGSKKKVGGKKKKKNLGGSLRKARARRKKLAEEAAKKKKEEKEKREREAAKAAAAEAAKTATEEEENPLLAMLARSGAASSAERDDATSPATEKNKVEENPLLATVSRSSEGASDDASSAQSSANNSSESLLAALSLSGSSSKVFASGTDQNDTFSALPYASSSTSSKAGGSQLLACLHSLDLMDCLQSESVSTHADIESMRDRIDRTAEYTHNLIKDTLWAEWRRRKGIPVHSKHSSNMHTSDSSPSETVARKKMISNLGELISAMCDSPKLTIAVGCSLPAQAQPDFAATLVDLIFSEFSSDERPLLALLDAAAIKFGEMHQMHRSLMRSMYGETEAAAAASAESLPGRRNQCFLGYLLERFCVRSEVVSFGSSIVDLAEQELVQVMGAMQKQLLFQEQEYMHQRESKQKTSGSRRRSRNSRHSPSRRELSRSPSKFSGSAERPSTGQSRADQKLLSSRVKSASVQAATRIACILTTQWSRDAMPKGLRSVLVSLQRAQAGPISALSALVDFVIVPAVHEWFVYNAHHTQGLVRFSKSHCNEATELVVSVLRQVVEMNMEEDSTEDEDTSKRASSMSRMTLRAQSAAIQPRMALAAFLEKTLKLDALGDSEEGR